MSKNKKISSSRSMEDTSHIDDPTISFKNQDKLSILKHENLSKSINQLSLSSSMITLNLIDCLAGSTSSVSGCSIKIFDTDNETEKKNSEASEENVQTPLNEKPKDENLTNSDPSKSEPKLKSPYGDWCAFEGGGGSGGCIITGPYEPMIILKDEFSDESFESTEESDATVDMTGEDGITHKNFQNTEVVWAKRPALPWFPGILIDPNKITKEIKELMKQIGATMPLNDQLVDYSSAVVNCKQTDKVFFAFLFSRKKTWVWLPESKLRPFRKENESLYENTLNLLSNKYRRELEKAFKKAKKIAKNYDVPLNVS